MNKKNPKFIDKSSKLPDNKLKNQCMATQAALKNTLIEVFFNHRPLDRVISAYFRANRQLGSRDRQFINESIFSFFRYFLVTKKLISEETWQKIQNGDDSFFSSDLEKSIYSGLLLAGLNFEAMRFFSQKFGKINLNQSDFFTQANELLAFFEEKNQLTLDELYPENLINLATDNINIKTYLDNLTERPPMWIRHQKNELKTLLDEFNSNAFIYEFHPKMANAIALYSPKVNIYTLESFKKGSFEVQDLASQVIGLVVNPQSGERCLDICAGAGGKSLQLASLMNNKGTVVACDIRSYKLQDLKLRARRAAFPNIMIKEYDGNALKGKQIQNYDHVLVDAPCSCSGVWRRNVDGRWIFNSNSLEDVSQIQLDILEKASRGVKINGHLTYATCSIFKQENEDVINKFLEKHEEFKLVEFKNPLDDTICSTGMLQVDASIHNCDSMFVAKMKRK